jgi:hypothetical protein
MIDNTSLSTSELKHYTNLWCKELGIKSSDLGQVVFNDGKVKHKSAHPQIEDVVLLANIRNEFWGQLNNQDRGVIAGLWGMVYTQRYPLKKKHLQKLENIIQAITKAQLKQQFKRNKIKALRTKTA